MNICTQAVCAFVVLGASITIAGETNSIASRSSQESETHSETSTPKSLLVKHKREIEIEVLSSEQTILKYREMKGRTSPNTEVAAKVDWLIKHAECVIEVRSEEKSNIDRWEKNLLKESPGLVREVLRESLTVTCARIDARNVELVKELRQKATIPDGFKQPRHSVIHYQLEASTAMAKLAKMGYAFEEPKQEHSESQLSLETILE